MDDDGYLNITGRIKDMVIRGGENIYPREIEEFLYTHPDVLDAQVIGVPDERYGEALMAWVRMTEGAEPLTAEALPELKTVDHVATMGNEKAAWFCDTEGNILCIHEVIDG